MLIKKLFLVFVFFLFGSLTPLFAFQLAPEQPPVENPHPAVSEADKKRVAFAELVIKHLQTPQDPLKEKSTIDFRTKVQLNISEKCLLSAECINQADKNGYLKTFKVQFNLLKTYKHVHIIPWSFEKFQNQHIHKNQPTASAEVKLPSEPPDNASLSKPKIRAEDFPNRVVPEMLPGEYMIHSYVLFYQQNPGNNRQIISSEDELDSTAHWSNLHIIISEGENGELKLQRLYTTPLPYRSVNMPDGFMC